MDTDDVQIGERLQVLRGPVISQAGLANAMKERGHDKWSQATVWAVEQGKRPLRLSEAASLAAILNAEVDDLLVSKGAARAMTGIREALFHLNEQGDRLADAVRDFELSRYALLLAVSTNERDILGELNDESRQRVEEQYRKARQQAELTAEDVVAHVKPEVVQEAQDYGIDL